MRWLVPKLAVRNLRSDWFATLCAIIGVALGAATVNVVLTLDLNTRAQESRRWSTNPDLPVDLSRTIGLAGYRKDGTPTQSEDAKEETHEDYQVMRSAIRLGSLSAFLVGALIVFFTFRVVVEQRRREIALLRSLGTSRTQVVGIFLLEAVLVGLIGSTLGFLMTPPLSVMAAIAGITTTGRSQLYWLTFPWKTMAFVSLVGAGTAILGVLRPLQEVLDLDVAATLRPRYLEEGGPGGRPKRTGLAVLALPFMALLYVLIRPFFVEVLPSLLFFVLEAGLVCAGFLSLLVLVPQAVSLIGALISRLLPEGPKAARLLTVRRLERAGHEFAWSVSGVMLVFALLLGLHVVTHALKREVVIWANDAIKSHAFVYSRSGDYLVHESLLEGLDGQVHQVPYTSRTPWPNSLMAADTEAFRALLRLHGEDTLADRFGRGQVILSSLMARRYGLGPGDFLQVQTASTTRRLEVLAVNDLGYLPMIGPYRDSKTYGLISTEDHGLIREHAGPLGAGVLLYDRAQDASPERWLSMLRPTRGVRGFRAEVGALFTDDRVKETDRDFVIFDLILFLTAVLASVGIANNLVLSAHVRRREIGLYRVLGMQASQIRTLFLLEAAFIGLLGGIFAVALGIPLGFLSVGALEVVSAFAVHFEFPASYAVWTLVGAAGVSLLSALYPAAQAARLDSKEAVHYE
jgi:putative ABC transport system permease protein